MYCKYCGKRLPDDARFCIYCGHGVSESVEEGQNVRGGDEPRNYAAFEETQGAGNYYRPYPIAVEDMAVPEKKRKKNLLPIVILVAVIVLLGAAVVFAFHIKNRETGEQENKNGKTQSESSNTDESRIENKDAKGSGDANDVKGSQASAPGKLTAIVTSAVPDELAGRTELYFATAAASSELVQANTSIYNGAVCAVDGDAVTSWQEGAPGNGVGETLTIGFLEPQCVDYLEFNAGNWRDENQWNRNLKPKGLEITVNGERYEVELQNVRASQYVVFSEPVETAAFVIRITDVYPGAEGESDVPISEVRAFGEALGKNERTISDTQPKVANSSADGNTSADTGKNNEGNASSSANAGVNGNVSANAGISKGGSLRYNEAGNPDWFETRYFWKQSDGDCVCRVSGNSGKDLTFEFSDGVVLSEKYCAYEIQADGTVLYSYKKGWTVKYDPASDTLFPVCDFNPLQAECEGAYFPISQDEFERNLPGGTMGANDGDYSKENWMRSQTATRMIIKHLDNYGSLSFISDSGKSAITFDEDKEGSDSTDMFYTNISGVTPDDMWGIMDGGVAGNIATLQVRNAQGQRAKVVADFESGTVDFAGVIYRNTATRYYP